MNEFNIEFRLGFFYSILSNMYYIISATQAHFRVGTEDRPSYSNKLLDNIGLCIVENNILVLKLDNLLSGV